MKNKENKNYKISANPFPQMEEQVLDFWDKAQIFKKSVENSLADGIPRRDYIFYDGPPFATGEPHYGHIVASTMKDVVPRYWTMKGYRVERKWGWDCHGLPIENIAEKELGITHKKEIIALGVEKFNEFCRSKVLTYVNIWEKVIRRLGRWADMKNAYRTMDLDYMESIWWVFKQLWDKGLIYQGYRSMHICPRCETTLSQQEVAEGYKNIKDLSVTAKFELLTPLSKGGEEGVKTFVLAWTTTPWTLIGNAALVVGEKIVYVVVKTESSTYILAEDRLELIKEKHNIVKKLEGKDLVGKKYKPLFNYYAKDKDLENKENGWKIYASDFVTTAEGTGVVHIAPAFGEDDMNLGKEHNLPFIQHVNMDGTIKSEAKDFAGLNVKPIKDHMSTDVEIIKYLAKHELLFSKEKYEHSYPHCWRCETPLINYATTSWFVNITKIKKRALELAEKIEWSPKHIKAGRFGDWLEGARDWSISRQRYWASVMPIWKCDQCGRTEVFGSVKDLEKASGAKITDLHKHIVDKITFPCSCGGEMKRVPDVLDTWFDSGSMPYAQMHYPFENKEKFEANFPAEFIAEGVDQTRAWFYYLHILSTAILDKHAFRNVIANGIVLAEDGKKMAKRLKNYPDPSLVFEKYGADAMRFYLMSSPVVAANDLNFSETGVKEALQKNIMVLWNVYKFYELFAGDRELNENLPKPNNSSNILDLWVLARLEELIKEVTESMDKYDLPRSARPMTEFINDFSTWYLRRSRERFKSDDAADKQNALATTKHVLVELSKVMAPFMPFLAEQVWQKTSGHNFQDENRSVHLESWPKFGDEKNLKQNIIEEMEMVRKIVELGLAARDQAGIKVRQPLAELRITNYPSRSRRAEADELQKEYEELIKDELNVKKVTAEKGKGELKVELDTVLTDDLKLEGLKREIVRLVNTMRKNSGLTIKDKVVLSWQSDSQLVKDVFSKMAAELKKEILSDEIVESEVKGEGVKVNEENILLGIRKNNL